jgi:hypothetical protein
MKTWSVVIVILALIAVSAPALAQKSEAVPKYNPATEVTLKGTVEDVTDRQCPVSGGLGSHLLLKLSDNKTIEVHLAATKFVKTYDLVFHKGDEVEVIGSKVQFEGVETIFARQVKRGNDTFVFREKDGTPVW